jgi:hypothetical protein
MPKTTATRGKHESLISAWVTKDVYVQHHVLYGQPITTPSDPVGRFGPLFAAQPLDNVSTCTGSTVEARCPLTRNRYIDLPVRKWTAKVWRKGWR